MDTLSQFSDQLRMLIEHHMPAEAAVPLATAVPIGMIAAGLGTAVLGAKLTRSGITMFFFLLGAVGGAALGEHMEIGLSPLLTGAIGGVLTAILGFAMHRLWVGLMTCVLLGVLAGGGLSYHSVLPQLESYRQMPPLTTRSTADFTTPDPEMQKSNLNPKFEQWARGFWDHATTRDTTLERNLSVVTAAAAVFGLMLGLLAPRFTLIAVTSVMGTAMLTFGATALIQQWHPKLYEAAVYHPRAAGAACCTFLLGSLILQVLLTRPDKPRSAATPAKA